MYSYEILMCVVEFRLPAIQDLTLVQLQLHEILNMRWKNEIASMKPDRLQISAFFGKMFEHISHY